MPRGKKDEPVAGRPDKRKATSMYLMPHILDALKKAAIDEKRNAYEIVEDAVVAYLKKAKHQI
jgi:hypothetical protein